MNSDYARELMTSGRFKDAFQILNALPSGDLATRTSNEVLKAELLERIGRHVQAKSTVTVLENSKKLTPGQRSTCELVRARIEFEAGDTNSALSRISRAVALADTAGERAIRAKALIWSLPFVADRSGIDACSPLVSQIRNDLVTIGSAHLWANFHAIAAQIDAKRGLVRNARRHVRVASGLLSSTPNVWINAIVEGVQVGIALLECDVRRSESHARKALDFAMESGVAAAQRSALGNLAYVLFMTGHFAEALEVVERANSTFPSSGTNHAAILETKAQVMLALDDVDECANQLRQVRETLRDPVDRGGFSYRGSAFTAAQLLHRQGRLADALQQARLAQSLAESAGDHYLQKHAALLRAEIELASGGQTEAVVTDALSVVGTMIDQPLDIFAHYQRLLALASAVDGNSSNEHYARCLRLYKGIGYAPALLETARLAEQSNLKEPAFDSIVAVKAGQHAGITVCDLAALVVQSGRPYMLANEIIRILETTQSVQSAWLVNVNRDGTVDQAQKSSKTQGWNVGQKEQSIVRLAVGMTGDSTVEVAFVPRKDVEASATIAAVQQILTSLQELDRARAERENRLTLWPIDDDPPAEDGFIILGRMRELMALARKVARARVTVLITGESRRQQIPENQWILPARGDRHGHAPGRTAAVPRPARRAA